MSEGTGASRRVGTLTAISSVVVVAVVVAGALVAWIQLTAGAGDTDGRATGLVEEEPPAELPGGHEPGAVPAAVGDAVDEPVVGAVVLDALPEGTEGCGPGPGGTAEEGAELVWAVVTPDGLHVGIVFDEDPWAFEGVFEDESIGRVDEVGRDVAVEVEAVPPAPPPHPRVDQDVRFLETCVVEWQRGGWVTTGGSSGTPVPLDGPIPADGGMSMSCCDEHGIATAQAQVAPPDGAAWVLQDRGVYWLGYPVGGLDVVPLSWRFRESGFGPFGRGAMSAPSTRVLFVAEDGDVIEERFVGDW